MFALLPDFLQGYVKLCEVAVTEHQVCIKPKYRSQFLQFFAQKVGAATVDAESEVRFLRLTLKLCQLLWNGTNAGKVIQDGSGAFMPRKVRLFLLWLEETASYWHGEDDLNLQDVYGRLFRQLILLKVNAAAMLAKAENYHDLAELLFCHPVDRYSKNYQAMVRKALRSAVELKNRILCKILHLLSGDISLGSLSACEGLDWLTCFAVHSYYSNTPKTSLPRLAEEYKKAIFRDSSYAAWPSSADTGGDRSSPIIWSSILQLCTAGDRRNAPLLHLAETNVEITWLCMKLLQFSRHNVDKKTEEDCTLALVHFLEQSRQLDCATAILLHLPPTASRDTMLERLIKKSIRFRGEHLPDSMKNFYLDVLNIDPRWINEGQAQHALHNGRFMNTVACFINAGNHAQAAHILVTKVIPVLQRDFLDEEHVRRLRRLPTVLDALDRVPDTELSSVCREHMPLLRLISRLGWATGRLQGMENDFDHRPYMQEELHALLVLEIADEIRGRVLRLKFDRAMGLCPNATLTSHVVEEAGKYLNLVDPFPAFYSEHDIKELCGLLYQIVAVQRKAPQLGGVWLLVRELLWYLYLPLGDAWLLFRGLLSFLYLGLR